METEDKYIKKLVGLAGDFDAAYSAGEWGKAKLIYDEACTVVFFLDTPKEVYESLFGYYNEEKDAAEDGRFDTRRVNRVMRECLQRNRMGFECMVYRVPGEVGYHGAHYEEGARLMIAQENPAYVP